MERGGPPPHPRGGEIRVYEYVYEYGFESEESHPVLVHVLLYADLSS